MREERRLLWLVLGLVFGVGLTLTLTVLGRREGVGGDGEDGATCFALDAEVLEGLLVVVLVSLPVLEKGGGGEDVGVSGASWKWEGVGMEFEDEDGDGHGEGV